MRRCWCPECELKRPISERIRQFEKELHENNQVYYLIKIFEYRRR